MSLNDPQNICSVDRNRAFNKNALRGGIKGLHFSTLKHKLVV